MTTETQKKPSQIEFYGGYQVYSESGIDLTLLDAQLNRTIEDRIGGNRRSLHLIYALQESTRKEQPWRNDLLRPPMLDARPILQVLVENRVKFILIGGLAMTAHGSAYITNDIDVCYQRSSENITALAAALEPIHPYLRGAPPGLPFCFDAPTIAAGLNFTLDSDLGPIDLLGEVRGVGFFEDAVGRSAVKEMYGLSVTVMSIDDLIASKRAADRPKDRNHVLELIELKKILDSQQ